MLLLLDEYSTPNALKLLLLIGISLFECNNIFTRASFHEEHKVDDIKTYYCLWQAVGNDLMFEIEVIDPKDNQQDMTKED